MAETRDNRYAIAFSDSELDRIREAAELDHRNASDFIRSAALMRADEVKRANSARPKT